MECLDEYRAKIEAEISEMGLVFLKQLCDMANITTATLQLHILKGNIPEPSITHWYYRCYTREEAERIVTWIRTNLKRRKRIS